MSMPGLTVDPQSALHAVLRECEGQHVHFFPKYGNCGDGFISYATYKIFEAYNITFTAHRQGDVVHNCIVFIGGGGNLIEGLYSHVADVIQSHCRSNKIILLPHTIVGYAGLLNETFRNLKVFCRDRVSYDMALANGANENNLHLAHDMTLYLDNDHFHQFLYNGSGVLNAFRADTESEGRFDIPEDNIDISRSWDGDIWTSPVFSEYACKSLFAFLAQFKVVLTDRLHVSIIGSFLQKRVILLPNSYFKNEAVYTHSMRDRFPHTSFGWSLESKELTSAYGVFLQPRSTAIPALPSSTDDDIQTEDASRRDLGSGIRAFLQRTFRK